MARIPYKHLVLLLFFFFFFFFISISTNAGARSLPAAKETRKPHHPQQLTSTKDGGEASFSVDELVSMDYTPATIKPPIHN
ncbi:hypothetical protein V6N12_001361 [Hibiscus sabdariffa]|uniref:Uncharacterized protein n=1 Tax=Hibiscus sabdariffa TaxID=183260 RepID=A0ABR2AVS8_9ROSI